MWKEERPEKNRAGGWGVSSERLEDDVPLSVYMKYATRQSSCFRSSKEHKSPQDLQINSALIGQFDTIIFLD